MYVFMQNAQTLQGTRKLLVERVEEYLNGKGHSAVIFFQFDSVFVTPHEWVVARNNQSFASFIAPRKRYHLRSYKGVEHVISSDLFYRLHEAGDSSTARVQKDKWIK